MHELRIRSSLRAAVTRRRMVFAAKTAVAVGVAWFIAPLMPGVTDDYPYYAPFGALISMYPTLMTSVRSSLQTLLGLTVGVGLAALVLITVGPSVGSLAATVAVGTLLSGTGWFGTGREYIPVASLFVLIVGGAHADEYSISYVVQTGVGMLVGLGINLILPPPPEGLDAATHVDQYQRRLAAHLEDVADSISESWPPERVEWMHDSAALDETSRQLRSLLDDAQESRRLNPRARRHEGVDHQFDRLEVLDAVAYQVRDITGALGDTAADRGPAYPMDISLIEPIAQACRDVAALLTAEEDDEGARERASAAIDDLQQALYDRTLSTERIAGPGVLAAMHLRRIVLLLTP